MNFPSTKLDMDKRESYEIPLYSSRFNKSLESAASEACALISFVGRVYFRGVTYHQH